MPTKKDEEDQEPEEKYICQYCGDASYKKQSSLKKHEASCSGNPLSMQSIRALGENRESLVKIDSLIKEPSFQKLSEEKQQRIFQLKEQVEIQIMEDEFRKEQEKGIQNLSDTNRGKRALLQNYRLDEGIRKFESKEDPIDRLIKVKTVESLQQKNQNQDNSLIPSMMNITLQQSNMMMQMQQKQHEFQMRMLENFNEKNKKGSSDLLAEIERIDKISKNVLGYQKGEPSTSSDIMHGLTEIANITAPILKDTLVKKRQGINPSEIELDKKGNVTKIIENPQPPIPAPIENLEIPTTPNPSPSIAPMQTPSDEELLNNPALNDDSRPSFRENYPLMDEAMSQYLKPASTTTSPMTPSP